MYEVKLSSIYDIHHVFLLQQEALVTDSQSYDSGVSESESESELQELMSRGQVSAVVRQDPEGGRAYVTLSPGKSLSRISPETEVCLVPSVHEDWKTRPTPPRELQARNSSPVEVRLKPFVSREYKVSPSTLDEIHLIPSTCRELRLIPSSSGEVGSARESLSDMRSPSTVYELRLPVGTCTPSRPPSSCGVRSSSQREVICLPISPKESSSSQPVQEGRSRDSSRETRSRPSPAKTGKRTRPLSTKDMEVMPAAKDITSRDQGKDITDQQATVTSATPAEGDRTSKVSAHASVADSMKGGRHCTPVFPGSKVSETSQKLSTPPPTHPVTLPKAAVKESKAKALKKAREKAAASKHCSPADILPVPTSHTLDSRGGKTFIMAGRPNFPAASQISACRRESSV